MQLHIQLNTSLETTVHTHEFYHNKLSSLPVVYFYSFFFFCGVVYIFLFTL